MHERAALPRGEYSGCSFDYSFTVSRGSGKPVVAYRFTSSPDLPHPLPRLTLRPEDVRWCCSSSAQDVQFESEVSQAWFVQSEHLPAAHDLIHPRMMGFLSPPNEAPPS